MEEDKSLLERILDGAEDPRDLPFELLKDITNGFSKDRKIGQGGFGEVYKGVLGERIVAVKRIHINENTIDDRLFRREVASLMKCNHRNVVQFLGVCSGGYQKLVDKDGSGEFIWANVLERLLCFRYISNGSLDRHINDELRGLEWEARYEIITGICKGLLYLHTEKDIIHMDLKPANILLDHQDEKYMVPKITDFGLSRPNKNSHTMGQRYGTLEYMAPEYREESETTQSCDIYSLGLIIIELVTGCKDVPNKDNVLRRWRHRWQKPPTQLQYQQVTRCIDIAEHCRSKNPKDRPSISKIINFLSLSESTYSQTSLYLYDDMLGVEPLELHFHLEHNKQTSCSVQLTNETINSIAFNIRTPNKQYNTCPDKGIVLPGHKLDVKITLQPQESATQVTNSDKFIVQSTQVNEGLADEDITDYMFKRKGGKKLVDEVDLIVVYDPEKYQVDLSVDPQEEAVSKDFGSNSYNNTRRSLTLPQFLSFDPVESISRNQATSLMSDQTVDLTTGAIGSLLPKLSMLLNKYNLDTSIRIDVDCVIQELRLVRADLCNVSEVQRDNKNEQIKLVKRWADEVRELSYDIEDIVDDIMHVKGSEPATSTGGLMGLILKMMGLFKLGRTSHQIGSAIKYIKNQVQNKADWKGKYKVEEFAANTASTFNAHYLSALVKHREELFGIDNAVKDFTKRLRGADGNGLYEELKVHSIFGIGGLGKTTLARAVHNRLEGYFRLTVFVSVGRNTDVKKLLYDILFELDEQRYIKLNAANLDEKKLINVLREMLKNKRYLIVIDDMWDIKVWHDWIKFAFVDDKCGSKIIITTRIFEVAAIATFVYKLNPLSHHHSEELFCATLSPGEGRFEYDVTDEVIEKILSKCRGVPLAIITIASLLASKQRDDWPNVYKSIGFGTEVNDYVDNTRKILLFSYSDLPRHLRTCLLHLSIFSEDKVMIKDMVIWKWVAEGFVHEEPGKGLFELGERYFNQLVNRSMIQLVVETFSSTIDFRIHDLVLDMICSLSKVENFVTVLEGDEQDTPSKNIEQGWPARRLAVQKREIEKQDPPDCTLKLRSFYATYCHISVMPPLLSFKALRVLSLEKCTFIEDQPYELEHIGKLLQLRYLGLDGMPICKLPEEIRDLAFLQTLILKGNKKIKELPHSVCLLRQLKCLRVTNVEVPDWLVNMTSLEDLSFEGVRKSLVFADGLSKLKELRDLHMMVHGPCDVNWNRALVKSIGSLLKLQSLRCYFMGNDEMWEGFVPPRHLHSMTMWVGFYSVPPWMDATHLPNLSYLELNLRNVEAHCLEILGRFPILHILKLQTGRGTCLDVTGSAFPKLRHLYSRTMLRFQPGVMQRLEYLELFIHVGELREAKFDCDFTSLGNLPLLQNVRLILNVGEREDADLEYAKRMEAAVKHALDTHPHRLPILHLHGFEKYLDGLEGI